MVIRGEKVNLRAVERADAPLIWRWWNDPAVMRYWGAPESTVSLAEVERRVEEWLQDERDAGRPGCLIVETLEGEAIGQVVLSEYRPEARSVVLSLMIGETVWWGQGYGTDLVKTILGACFDTWNLHRVVVRSETSNERAHRLYARCGFTLEATLRDAAFFDGRFEDVLVFGILEDA